MTATDDLRALFDAALAAVSAEAAMLARKGLPWHHRSNPFWRYAALQTGFLGLALLLGGWVGLGLFLVQAFVAIWQLELVNYDKHLVRLAEHTVQSIETSSLHIDLISDLKRINSHICSIAYPILDSAGALAPDRIRHSVLDQQI